MVEKGLLAPDLALSATNTKALATTTHSSPVQTQHYSCKELKHM